MDKIILGIETSCDETAAAVLQKSKEGVHILSNVVATSQEIQAKYGGVVPEQAAREQLKSIIPVIQEALLQAFPKLSLLQTTNYKLITPSIDAIAVTQGPGLIGSLLVGVETAKTLATVWGKPLIPVNHLIGHFYANWVQLSDKKETQSDDRRLMTDDSIPTCSCIGLLVSGGHTDLILMTDHGKYKYLGGTRDDAAGECFDKCARLLGLPYPGGPAISQLAKKGNPQAFNLPRPMIDSGDFDFSFSGLKTAVANFLHTSEVKQRIRPASTSEVKRDLCASIEAAITDVLVKKTILAAQKYQVEQIIVAGGVAANQNLAEKFARAATKSSPSIKLFIPPPHLCTDNAAMIATAAFFYDQPTDPLTLQANPHLSLQY